VQGEARAAVAADSVQIDMQGRLREVRVILAVHAGLRGDPVRAEVEHGAVLLMAEKLLGVIRSALNA
jgi:hypothetical protein